MTRVKKKEEEKSQNNPKHPPSSPLKLLLPLAQGLHLHPAIFFGFASHFYSFPPHTSLHTHLSPPTPGLSLAPPRSLFLYLSPSFSLL